MNTEYLMGIGRHGEDFLIILDMDRVLSSEELNAVEGAMSVVPESMTKDTIAEIRKP